MTVKPDDLTIVFFDGVCGLCNKAVDRLLRADKHRRLHFAPLQGETAARLLGQEAADKLDTMVLWRGGEVHHRSRAVLYSLIEAGGPWKVLRVLAILPAFLGDALYRLVARNRYRWFGKRDGCRLPTHAEKERFLP